MRKIMTIVGTRPELIKMSPIIRRLDRLTNHILVHTGQNYDYELNKVFFEDLCIRDPDYFLNTSSVSAVNFIASVIEKVDAVLEAENPDALLIYGDTNSGLSVISAKRRKIPVFHMEAGNRCFDQRVPEELNRKVIDHLSDVNMTLTEHARRYLLAEGLPADRIFCVGSHMKEVLNEYRERFTKSTVLKSLGLEKDKYFLVSAHREENVDDPKKLEVFLACLERLVSEYNIPVIVSTHPRTKKRLQSQALSKLSPLIRFLPPFGFIDYVHLQQEANCVLSDSGTITEEASLLNLRAVTLRDAHERPEGMDAGTLVMASIHPDRVIEAVHCALDGLSSSGDIRVFSGEVSDYKSDQVSAKVVRIVLSYIDKVNRDVWRKPSITL